MAVRREIVQPHFKTGTCAVKSGVYVRKYDEGLCEEPAADRLVVT
jgi:hypothetical protein